MKLRIDFDESDVMFLKDIAESHINEIRGDIDEIKKQESDELNKTLLELYKINISGWDRLFEVAKDALSRRGLY